MTAADTTPDPTPDAPDTETPSTAPTLVFDERKTAHSIPEDVLGILTGTFTAAFGLYLLAASDAVTGGTAGLALLVTYASPLPFWVVYAAVNLPFAALALWKKGLSFTLRTVASIGLVSAFSVLNAAMLPIDRVEPVFGVLAGNLFAGVGLLILFRHRASLGGINIVALLVQDKTGFRAGWTQMVFDLAIIAVSFVLLPWPVVLLSAAGAVLLNLVLAMNHRPGRYIGH
ncbi:YitT family protein [Microbacterium sp. P06]|uniref:YitT family protein n=1 Tax=unclassified Microbacterium TaxID=2609290 RepID=UPI003744D2C2